MGEFFFFLVVLTAVRFAGTVDSDEETPPPLPQRTPDSYLLAEDKGWWSRILTPQFLLVHLHTLDDRRVILSVLFFVFSVLRSW